MHAPERYEKVSDCKYAQPREDERVPSSSLGSTQPLWL